MSLLTPLAGLLLAAAVVPPLVLLYVLRLRRRSLRVPSTLLWEQATEDLRANAPFQRLRPSWLLLLQVLAVGLLAAAIMQPQLAGADRVRGRTILMIDRSASMNARDGGADGDASMSRLEAAKRAARDRVETLYAGGLFGRGEIETMVIALGERAEVATRFTRSREQLLQAIDAIEPTDGRSRLGDGLQLARAWMTNTDPESNRPQGEPATLEVFSDGLFDDLDEEVLRGEPIVFHRTGRPGGSNLSVIRAGVGRPYDAPEQVEVFASLVTHDLEPVTSDVELRVDGRLVAVREVTVPAATTDAEGLRRPGRANVLFSPFELREAAIVTVGVVRPDVLASGDVASVVVPAPRRLDVLLVSDRGGLVQDVLEGLRLRSLTRIGSAEWAERMAGLESTGVDVVVGDDFAPPEGLMPAGRYLLMGRVPPVRDLQEFGTTERQLVLRVDQEHPVMRYVSLEELLVGEARAVQPDRTARVLVRGTEGPLVIESRREGRDAIVVAFDPLESTWPLQRSFVTFIFNAVEHLGRLGSTGMREGLVPGDAIAMRLPATARSISLTTPDGEREAVPPLDPARFSWGPATRLGVHRVGWEDADGRDFEQAVAVTLADEAEMQVDPAESLVLGTERVRAVDAAEAGYRPLWPWAIGLALVVLSLEWALWTRRAAI
ncbi:MAG: vWA domain-containing protein [Planctomycetota bacterium]